jgi:hypothetical protein
MQNAGDTESPALIQSAQWAGVPPKEKAARNDPSGPFRFFTGACHPYRTDRCGSPHHRIAEKGYRVVGFDIDQGRTRAAFDWGVTPANSAAEVARTCDVILVSVINTAAVEDVALGPDGIVAVGRGEGKILVDHSTTELDATQRIAAALAERCGMMFVDAPVSGGPGAAKWLWPQSDGRSRAMTCFGRATLTITATGSS